ncbi:pectate lyase family protein [Jeotgalibacillus soli]|uniref:Ptate lyase n=1 Tax=Jeotgalibacillus soli TaxID=889306 RepID=A0A0C2RPE1_9BACL|nr:hypothetical protein [Jeotgalibacillus soli]KIL52125.1 ptate lyase [Jeotgalibacillus soli]
MKKRLTLFFAVFLLSFAFTVSEAGAKDLGLEVLSENDGWAAYGEGTTGGAEAEKENVYTVKNRKELIQALGGNNSTNAANSTPKIIYVKGEIELNVNELNEPIDASYYADPHYDFDAYLEVYSPDSWGYDEEVYGPLEEARQRSQRKQQEQIVVNIGSNTSIIGLGKDAKISGGSMKLNGVENIIIRNIEFEAPVDFFPQWDPTDGSEGNWNSEYDNIQVINSSHHVWIDHNTFSDGDYLDSKSGEYFGRPYQQHDGLLDITNASSYVTASYNVFKDHDKVSIIGSSDSRTTDRNQLKVTLHHNYYQNLSQRLPRVRFGEVHIYNNFYEFSKLSEYQFSYGLGVGIESKIYAENNYFKFDWNVAPSTILKDWKGTSIYESGSIVKGTGKHQFVDLVAEFNRVNAVQFNENVGWKPTLYEKIHPTQAVPALVKAKAGAGKLSSKYDMKKKNN